MPKNILIDLNVILDVFLRRKGYQASAEVLKSQEHGKYRLYISAHMVSTLAYLLEHAKVPRSDILTHIGWVLAVFRVVATDDVLLNKALKSGLTDFEDAIVAEAASTAHAVTIVTRNTKDFSASTVPVQSPEEFLRTF